MFLFVVILITIFVIMFAQFNQADMTLELMYTNLKFDTTFFAISILTYCTGIISGILLMLKAIFKGVQEHGKIRRVLERTSVGADDSDLKVKTLENKIATLETALQKVLKQDEAVLKEAQEAEEEKKGFDA